MARLRDCGADAELIQLAERCLAENKVDRPADGDEVAAAVAAYMSGVQERLQRERVERERQQVRAVEERRRRVQLALSATVVLVLVLAGSGYFLWWRDRQQAREFMNLSWDRGRQLCEQGEVAHGLLILAQALQRAPDGQEDADLRDSLRADLAGWLCQCHTLEQVWPHPGVVHSVAGSPDGRTAVTGCDDGKIRVWDARTGTCWPELVGHDGPVYAVAFSPAGNAFITGGSGGKVFLWDARGTRIAPLEGHTGDVRAVALSPDGKRALSGGRRQSSSVGRGQPRLPGCSAPPRRGPDRGLQCQRGAVRHRGRQRPPGR